MSRTIPTNTLPTPSHTDATPGPPIGDGPSPGGLAALIQEAEALNESLADARSRTGRLVAAPRRYRRRERLVSSTLASPQALKLQEAAE